MSRGLGGVTKALVWFLVVIGADVGRFNRSKCNPIQLCR